MRNELPGYVTVQVILGGGGLQQYDRGASVHTEDSNKSNYFRHHSDITYGRNIDLLGGDSDSEI